jgi:hypothetical protein
MVIGFGNSGVVGVRTRPKPSNEEAKAPPTGKRGTLEPIKAGPERLPGVDRATGIKRG